MVENNVKENLLDGEEEIYMNLNDLVNLRESAELKEAADAFECYLEDYALATGMPQSVLSDICHLSVQAAHRGMEFCFMKGFEMGARVMKSALEEEMTEGVKPRTEDKQQYPDTAVRARGLTMLTANAKEACKKITCARIAQEV